ncbi:ABC transporter permease [candidate division WOR-3 bacterium]|nr:ABC transporter permease [candidate division WOR-3 bacterium]
MFILKLAFKNILRNHRRTALTTLSIAIAAIVLIFGQAFMDGIYKPMYRTMLDMQTGHIRITPLEYLEKERLLPVNRSIDNAIIEEQIKGINGIMNIRPRIRFGALLAKNEEEIDGMLVIGIRPESEKENVFLRDTDLLKGEILVSTIFAKKYNIDINDTIVLITQTKYGYLNGTRLVVREFYKTGISCIANTTVFMHIDDTRFLLSLPQSHVTEIMIIAKSDSKAYSVFNEIDKILKDNNDIDIIYYESEGSLVHMMRIGIYFMYIFYAIIFALASIAIINTMIMALYERTKEIGMMKSLGLTNKKVFMMFLIETIIITLIGALIGVFIGSGITYYFEVNGIDISSAMNGIEFPMETVWYTDLSIGAILWAVLFSFISGISSSLFLIKRIWKVNPIEVLRE